MGKYDYLKSRERQIFNQTKQGIGFNLNRLKMIKRDPDNFTPMEKECASEGLRIAINGYHRMLRKNPTLKGPKQLDLFKDSN